MKLFCASNLQSNLFPNNKSNNFCNKVNIKPNFSFNTLVIALTELNIAFPSNIEDKLCKICVNYTLQENVFNAGEQNVIEIVSTEIKFPYIFPHPFYFSLSEGIETLQIYFLNEKNNPIEIRKTEDQTEFIVECAFHVKTVLPPPNENMLRTWSQKDIHYFPANNLLEFTNVLNEALENIPLEISFHSIFLSEKHLRKVKHATSLLIIVEGVEQFYGDEKVNILERIPFRFSRKKNTFHYVTKENNFTPFAHKGKISIKLEFTTINPSHSCDTHAINVTDKNEETNVNFIIRRNITY